MRHHTSGPSMTGLDKSFFIRLPLSFDIQTPPQRSACEACKMELLLKEVVYCRCLSSTRTHQLMEWKRDRCAPQAEGLGRSCLSIARSALSLARSAQAERDNESCFFVRAAGVHLFIRRHHVKN
ncbi:hypothetical protein EVAR_27431_1 [Eumeta japonica]|uniref:Uncharacterized protein n=1 Tax=Eumeta variegata TaxID=151549 RepID=A0A4C1VKF1_EUMVA|nr:hypothetical protein EVAR_27431_1 [Eumeta japonica]